VDMEITFTSGLTDVKDKDGEETTLEKYERKMKEKRKKRKDGLKEKVMEQEQSQNGPTDDDFFDVGNQGQNDTVTSSKRNKGKKNDRNRSPTLQAARRHESTVQELALIAASDNPNAEPKHFNLKSILKAEKKSKGKGKKKGEPNDNEIQEDFEIDVKDDRFKALHEDHAFAIDPSNPHFKKTKSMVALLEDRSKRQKSQLQDECGEDIMNMSINQGRSLASLVENVKRKTAAAEHQGRGKRRRVY